MAPTAAAPTPVIRIGSRPSSLARVQAHAVHQRLCALFPSHTFELSSREIRVAGDRDKVRSLRSLSKTAESVWTAELEDALVAGELDIVVHCLKDCPTAVRAGCAIVPIMPREDRTDCLVLKMGSPYTSLAELPEGSVVGTGSVRRVAQIKRRYPGLRFQDLRGNIETRLAKLDDPAGPYAAAILASAGLIRLNLHARITAPLHPPDLYPAVGQGSLAGEFLLSNAPVGAMVRALEDAAAALPCRAERALLRVLEGGCAVPLGVWTTYRGGAGAGGVMTLKGVLTAPDGAREVCVEASAVVGTAEDAEALGVRVAARISAGGGREIMDDLRAEIERAVAAGN